MRQWLLLLAALPLEAELLRVEQRFGGFECLSCVESIAKGIRRLRGAGGVEVNTKTNTVKIELEPGNRVKLAAIRDAVKATGFTPGEATVVAKGRLEPPRLVVNEETFEVSPPVDRRGEAEVEGEVPASGPGEPLRLKARRLRVIAPLSQPD